MGVVASTDWVSFDLNREDLLECLRFYAQEELKTGIEYTFYDAEGNGNNYINVQTALDHFYKSGKSPLTKWQTHMFRRDL